MHFLHYNVICSYIQNDSSRVQTHTFNVSLRVEVINFVKTNINYRGHSHGFLIVDKGNDYHYD